MKELEIHLNKGVKTELSVKKQQEVEYILEGTIKPRTGHFIWEINKETGEAKKAEYKRDVAVFNAKIPSKKLIIKDNCIYIPALNATNAKDKFLKDGNQSSYYSKEPVMKLM